MITLELKIRALFRTVARVNNSLFVAITYYVQIRNFYGAAWRTYRWGFRISLAIGNLRRYQELS